MAFCVSCGSQLANGERFCSKCGADQTAAAGGAPTTPPQYPPAAGFVPVAAMPPAAGMQNHNKAWYAVIGAAVLFLLYRVLTPGPALPPMHQAQSGPINLIFVVSEDLAYQSPGDVNPYTANLTSQGLATTFADGTPLPDRGPYMVGPSGYSFTSDMTTPPAIGTDCSSARV